MSQQDLASLALVTLVVAASLLLSLLLSYTWWQFLSSSRPSHTYCASCLYGEGRDTVGLTAHRLGLHTRPSGPGFQNLASSHLQNPYSPTLDVALPLDLEASTLSRSFRSGSREELAKPTKINQVKVNIALRYFLSGRQTEPSSDDLLSSTS